MLTIIDRETDRERDQCFKPGSIPQTAGGGRIHLNMLTIIDRETDRERDQCFKSGSIPQTAGGGRIHLNMLTIIDRETDRERPMLQIRQHSPNGWGWSDSPQHAYNNR